MDLLQKLKKLTGDVHMVHRRIYLNSITGMETPDGERGQSC